MKQLVNELRDIQEDFTNFIECYDVYWSWVETFKDVYNYIDQHYFVEKGFSFSDLEYFVCIGLRNVMIREKIKKNYDTIPDPTSIDITTFYCTKYHYVYHFTRYLGKCFTNHSTIPGST